MTQRIDDSPKVRIRHLRFPWPSAMAGLLAASYLLLMTEPSLVAFYDIPAEWFRTEVKFSVLGGFLALLLFDLHRYQRRYAKQKEELKEIRRQMDKLWQRNRELQLKAHTYSGHADKLKLFISDKLLEYIEYDEKFLHFKGIAAEVRHNGVISFDKVQTALKRAAATERTLPHHGSDSSRDPAAEFQTALDAMRYLWDLLDLSTADNLALHIGNLLCECEEHFVQRELNREEDTPLPYEPVYSPQLAAWRALGLVRPEPAPRPDGKSEYRLEDEQWTVILSPAGELLGNENHLVLLLDNLLKNAQFFSRKRSGKSGVAPISMTLGEAAGHAVLRVYNRGPHIEEEDSDRLFQLGYSTRRTREHHGRGLGLYFVNEIVKGYEGSISIHNIHTPETCYELKLELENDQVITHSVEVMLGDDGRPFCEALADDEEEISSSREWTLPAALRSIDITTSDTQSIQRLSGFTNKSKDSRMDPGHPEHPHWRLVYQPRRKNPKLRFEPMDISGVAFEIRLPTAGHRLESGEAALDEDIDAEVERLDERFQVPLK